MITARACRHCHSTLCDGHCHDRMTQQRQRERAENRRIPKGLIPLSSPDCSILVARAYLRAMNMKLERHYGEFCVRGGFNEQPFSYYTSWLDDAVGTAKATQEWKWFVAMAQEGKSPAWNDVAIWPDE